VPFIVLGVKQHERCGPLTWRSSTELEGDNTWSDIQLRSAQGLAAPRTLSCDIGIAIRSNLYWLHNQGRHKIQTGSRSAPLLQPAEMDQQGEGGVEAPRCQIRGGKQRKKPGCRRQPLTGSKMKYYKLQYVLKHTPPSSSLVQGVNLSLVFGYHFVSSYFHGRCHQTIVNLSQKQCQDCK
jgi:hypothetical protein